MKKIYKKTNIFIKYLFIRFIDNSYPKLGPLSKGFKVYKGILGVQNLEKKANKLYQEIINSKKIINLTNKNQAGQVLNFSDILFLKPEFVQVLTLDIIKDIKKFLGNNIKLDSVYFRIFFTKENQILSNKSGLFHHDSVGHRLKLFVPINPSGNKNSPTIYVKETNKLKWGNEIFRKNYEDSRLENFVKNNFHEKQHPIEANFGDIYMFDTNGIHKGSYNNSNEIRCIIQFEFSRYKSFLRGEVGPRTFYMHKKAYDYLNKFNLLREKLVSKKDNHYKQNGIDSRKEIKLKLKDFM